jgi:hypothetical protein
MKMKDGSSMQDSKVERYLNGRWQSQIAYYSKRSKAYKFWHQIFLFMSAVGAIIVPVLLNIPISRWVSTVISILVSIALALDNVFHFGDNWQSFRQALEALRRERVYFENEIKPYVDSQTAFSLFVQRCEGIMNVEGKGYFERHRSQEQSDARSQSKASR